MVRAQAQEGEDRASTAVSEPEYSESKQYTDALKKIDKKLSLIITSQEAIQRQLEALKEELQIVKVRCTR